MELMLFVVFGVWWLRRAVFFKNMLEIRGWLRRVRTVGLEWKFRYRRKVCNWCWMEG